MYTGGVIDTFKLDPEFQFKFVVEVNFFTWTNSYFVPLDNIAELVCKQLKVYDGTP